MTRTHGFIAVLKATVQGVGLARKTNQNGSRATASGMARITKPSCSVGCVVDVAKPSIRVSGHYALSSVDLENACLVSVEEKMVRDTTITIPGTLHKKLK
jgi:hypothetical protein